jgi:hypothetical protein
MFFIAANEVSWFGEVFLNLLLSAYNSVDILHSNLNLLKVLKGKENYNTNQTTI